jgi:hypothetical protein
VTGTAAWGSALAAAQQAAGQPASGAPTPVLPASAVPTSTVPASSVPVPSVPTPRETRALKQLLVGVNSDERQLAAVSAYERARTYLTQARVNKSVAAGSVSLATALWGATEATEVRALVSVIVATSQVDSYRTALSQLGLAEYTGTVHEPSGNDLASQERRLQEAQFFSVSSADTSEGLLGAEAELKASQADVVKDKVLVARAWAIDQNEQAVFGSAATQLVASKKALAKARRWATRPGAAPADPTVVLVAYEGKLADARAGNPRLQKALHAALHKSAPTSTSTSTSTTTTSASLRGQPADLSSAVRPELGLLGSGPSILGKSLLTASEIEGWYASTGAQARTTVPMARLVHDYLAVSRQTGVDADIAFAQSIVETAYFTFPAGGQVRPKDNNFAGIGACDSCAHGWRFSSAKAGVRAQEDLLEAYASPAPPASVAVWVRGVGVQGCCSTWVALSGIWASNPQYGYEILSVYKQMLDWALPRRLQAAGLVPVVPSQPTGSQAETAGASGGPAAPAGPAVREARTASTDRVG